MLNQNYIAKLLNLEDVIIKNVENKSDQLFIQIDCLEKRTFALPVGTRQTVYTTIASRLSKMFPDKVQ